MRIGIIAAMEEELRVLRKQLQHSSEKKIGIFEFHLGEIEGHSVVILLSGIGKVLAASATTLMIEYFKPSYILNTGTAGGLKKGLDIHHLIVPEEVIFHDVDLVGFGYKLGQMAGMPTSYKASTKLIQQIEKVTQSMGIDTERGMLVSGDTFVHSENQVRKIQEGFPKSVAIDMEAASIAQVCYVFGVDFVVIRAISDMVTQPENPLTFDQFVVEAGKTSAQMVVNFLKSIS